MPNISFVGAKKRKTRHSGRFRRMLVQHAHQASAQRSLLSLVDELLLNIIDQIDSHQTLCNLAATCTQFQDLTEPYIWRSLLVLTGAHAQLINTALDSREERIDFVQELSIRYRIQHKDGIEHLNHFIGLMGKLRRLTVESPCPNNTEWRSGMYFDGATRIDYTRLLEHAVYPPGDSLPTLPMLQSLTLHGHGQEGSKFIFGRAAVMFLHPTLRSITVSCLEFDATIALDNISNAKINSTPLQSLTLIECNVNIQFLDLVLSLPKALKELSIGERLHTFQECVPSDNPNTRTSSPLFLSALQRQSHSLERLIHIGGAVRYLTKLLKDDEGAEKLRSLTSLQHLELGLESPLFYYLFQNGFPPNLTTFKILDTAWSQAFRSMPHASSRSVLKRITDIVTKQIPPSLPAGFTLDLHFSDFSIARISLASESSDRDHRFYLANVFLDRPAVYKIASVMSSRSCRFRIFRECFLSGTSYIPPYMYGEETPVQKLMYDSNDYWCFEGDDYQIVDDEGRRKELKDARELIRCGRCVARGMECKNLGNGSSCLPCWAGRLACSWEKDDHGVWIWSATQSFGDGE